MATQSAGIQQLLQAEKKAAETVAEARKRRTQLLKRAKEEAVHEVEAFKLEKEKAYKALEQQTVGSRSVNEDSIKIKTDEAIVEMENLFQKNRDKVLSDILSSVCNVEPNKHENLIIR
ncbi:V-type proton ATPase subunit G 1 [Brachionus plicatilis]|uniref:V-type proton ATPase subunit G n=1 Tax=Brachionus plicatilis TaxID=10195 RepID=A0A3M7P5X7_BRAPC|nr:V-type proton ATPase subunit G 1 [Brachionus plicatilis]